MRLSRRLFCSSVLGGLLSAGTARSDAGLTVTDMAGRSVHLASPPKRMVLLEARDILTMALLHPDPASVVVGWAAVDRIDSGLLQERFMGSHRIEVVGRQTPDTISLEGLLSMEPDLVVASAWMVSPNGGDPLLDQLGKLGIPVIFSDVASNSDARSPLGQRDELRSSMRMWGQVLGAQERTQAFIDFFEEHVGRVHVCLAGAAPVTTYLEVQSTVDDCCWAAGNRIWGELLSLAGGQVLPDVTSPWFQKLSLEYLLSTPHDVYIATGGGWASGSRPAIGPGLDPKEGKKGLRRLIEGRVGFDQLPSVRANRVHGIWTGLIAVPPLNVLFIEVAAKWLHPERCKEIDPAATLEAINRNFLAKPIDGPLWLSL
ncbi:iron-siderophore ABC transporter substrate-binding protein [Rhizobium gallicum]|uniref:Iron-siderophore ABC transporter substrate-binding protein n=1 Tax=Rhizobium gallicum TaxID=56730 RepID=A0A1L5NM69_9HYPH|nr:ABC transporter substrate-binding protein [Rhizobium gallicum]APO69000.1 iron-siderophore ABC transporter substrate-binding protein [Rhizobium gallicum]